MTGEEGLDVGVGGGAMCGGSAIAEYETAESEEHGAAAALLPRGVDAASRAGCECCCDCCVGCCGGESATERCCDGAAPRREA